MAAEAAPVPGTPIAWGSCSEEWVGSTPGRLRDRLQCGTMRAPLDHVAPDGRTLDVGVIRVRAGVPSLRAGSIFFNPGGPGDHPGKLLRSIANSWTGTEATDPRDGSKRLLADRFDFVAVIPRGLPGSTEVRCLNGMPGRYAYIPTHLDDVNWGLMMAEAEASALACTAPEHARYINTEQHVHDMDMLRRSLGDPRIHIYGVSYGGMVAAWYASMYPRSTGRLLLDSPLDFTHDFLAAVRLSMVARHRAIINEVLGPVLANPVRYGLDRDPEVVAEAIANLPSRIREVWMPRIETPIQLAAALHVAPWWQGQRPANAETMARLMQRTPVTTDTALDERIRWEGVRLAVRLYAPPRTEPAFADSPEGDAVRMIVACNDNAWTASNEDIRRRAERFASRYWSYTGQETMEELTCATWGGPKSRQPDLEILAQAEPFLLLQSDKDTSTPQEGAAHIAERFPNATLLIVRNSDEHGLFNFTLSPCIESTAANYLLTGSLPTSDSRVVACNGTLGNALHAIPGAPTTPAVAPEPTERPSSRHEEL